MDTPIPTLAAKEHENMVGMLGAMAALAPGAEVRHEGGVSVIATGIPVLLFNQLLVTGDDADARVFEGGVTVLRERGAPFVVNLRDGADDAWVPVVQRLGLVPLSEEPWMPGMALDPLPEPGSVPVPDRHEIHRVTDLAGIEGHIAAASAGFGMPAELFRPMLDERMLDQPGTSLYVGYTDGQAVSAGLGYQRAGAIGVYNIATVEAYRRRGYGAAMTGRIVDDGRAAGCEVAILQSSEMGYRVYEAMRFRTVVRYRGWIDPAAVSP